MAVISLDCPNCGAKLQPDDSNQRVRCEYCGTQVELPRAKKPPRREREPTPPSAPPLAGQHRSYLISYILMVAVAVGMSGYFTWRANPDVAKAIAAAGGSPVFSGGSLMWDQVGGPPQVFTLDGAEHLVGRVRTRGSDELHVGVFAVDTGEERYRVGPFGTYSDGYRATHFAAVDDRLVVTDFRGKLRVFRLGDGEPVQDIALTDRAERLCLVEAPGEAPRLYLGQVDERAFLVDVAGPALKEQSLPTACDGGQRLHSRAGDPRLAERERLELAPKVDGVDVRAVHLDGELAVARAVKSPGTAYPMAFGFDPETREVRWKGPVAAVDLASVRERDNEQDILADGRYFATYGEGSEHWHLTAFDARTGARLWDNKLRSIFAVDWLYGIEATASHVFLVRMSSLEVYDAATGALKATIGAETYDG